MNLPLEIDQALSQSSGVVGRSRTTAHGVTITLDASRRPQPDGITNSEAFLGGVSSCGVTMIETCASEQQIPLARTRVHIEGFREPGVARYVSIHMRFDMTGVTEAQADQLLKHYQANCPLYGTLIHAAKVTVECHCAPA
jgi:uncharacterized OsmC-like protein